jgi:hypothetical protein
MRWSPRWCYWLGSYLLVTFVVYLCAGQAGGRLQEEEVEVGVKLGHGEDGRQTEWDVSQIERKSHRVACATGRVSETRRVHAAVA